MGLPTGSRLSRRVPPLAADGLLSAAVAAIQLLLLAIATDAARAAWRPVSGVTIALIVAQAVPLVVRRRWPVLVFAAVLVPNTLYYAFGFPPSGLDLGLAVALYTVAVQRSRRVSLLCCAAILVLFTGLWLLRVGPYWSRASVPLFLYLLVFFSAAWAWGRYHRTRQQIRDAYTEQLVAQTQDAERQRAERTERIVADERARIARELHDSVAHHMSVMVVQAGAARRVLDDDPDKTRAALHVIEESGRRGLSTMPSLIRALRGDDADDLQPQPTLAQLDALVRPVVAAGLPVTIRVEGCPRQLPPGVDLSAYRVIQEALTNALKHAGPARAEICVRYGGDDLEVDVSDDGYGSPVWDLPESGGHGLLGMRERVELFGGKLVTRTAPNGGFRVSARFPAAGASS